jgi:hypothetical protein
MSGGFNVISTHSYGVVVTEFFLAEGTTRDDTCHLKLVILGGNFSIVGAEGEAVRAIAASSGVEKRE